MAETDCFINGVRAVRRRQGVIPRPADPELGLPAVELPLEANGGEHTLVFISSPTLGGSFISAAISKKGGKNDNTFVILQIDDLPPVINLSFKFLKTMKLRKRNNPYGIVLHKGKKKVDTITIGFSTPLFFREKLTLKVKVAEEKVSKMVANVIWGRKPVNGEEINEPPPEPPD